MRTGLVVIALIAAGCGRLGFDQNDSFVLLPIDGVSPMPLGDIDFAATGTDTGFTVTWAPRAGGMMWGFNLDTSMVPDRDFRVTSARIDYVATTLAWTGARMTTMTTNEPVTFIKRYVPDLSSYAHTDSVTGIGAKPAYVASGDRWFYAIVDSSLLHVKEIASDGTPVGALLDIPAATTGAPLAASLTAGRDGNLYAMWSHVAGTCEWARIETSPLASMHEPVTVDCTAPRLAETDDGALAIFESSGGLVAMELQGTTASPVEWLDRGSDARLCRDGDYWIAWRRDGQLALARYDDTGEFQRVGLAGLPTLDVAAYELVARDGGVYLFALADGRLWWAAL